MIITNILWKLDRKIQARYFWKGVLKMKDLEEDMIKKINLKLVQGIKALDMSFIK